MRQESKNKMQQEWERFSETMNDTVMDAASFETQKEFNAFCKFQQAMEAAWNKMMKEAK